MRLLDLFCGAGGAAMGYYQAGFEIVGVDVKHQPRYPFEFVQADALEFVARHGGEFDVIHASPPCQAYSKLNSLHKLTYPDLIDPVRELLIATGRPYIIENIPEAPLINPLRLCGTMFGLLTIRHRTFETYPAIWWPPTPCIHWGKCAPKGQMSKFNNGDFLTITGHNFRVAEASEAMDIDWMTGRELTQAIPPAYTRWLGSQFPGLSAPDAWRAQADR